MSVFLLVTNSVWRTGNKFKMPFMCRHSCTMYTTIQSWIVVGLLKRKNCYSNKEVLECDHMNTKYNNVLSMAYICSKTIKMFTKYGI